MHASRSGQSRWHVLWSRLSRGRIRYEADFRLIFVRLCASASIRVDSAFVVRIQKARRSMLKGRADASDADATDHVSLSAR